MSQLRTELDSLIWKQRWWREVERNGGRKEGREDREGGGAKGRGRIRVVGRRERGRDKIC